MQGCPETCTNYVYLEAGEAVCDKKCPPVTVMESWRPTIRAKWCRLRKAKDRPEDFGQIALGNTPPTVASTAIHKSPPCKPTAGKRFRKRGEWQ